MNNLELATLIKNNIGLKNLGEDGAAILDDILALQTSKQDKLIAGNNITINEDGKTINAVSGDIVIYDEESGASTIEDIALEMGATYEMYITSAINNAIMNQYGQQKITIKLIPAEDSPNNYDLYMPVLCFELISNSVLTPFIHIYKYGTELWSVSVSESIMNIYKIVKKAV